MHFLSICHTTTWWVTTFRNTITYTEQRGMYEWTDGAWFTPWCVVSGTLWCVMSKFFPQSALMKYKRLLESHWTSFASHCLKCLFCTPQCQMGLDQSTSCNSANGHGHDSYRCVSSKSANVAKGVYVSLLVQWITSSILVHRLTIAMIKYKVKGSRNANGYPILRLFESSKFQLKNNWNENLILGPINNGFKTKTTWFQPVYLIRVWYLIYKY